MLRRTAPRTPAPATGTVLAAPPWHEAAGTVPRRPEGRHGPFREPDANGVALPEGFTSRIVARTGRRIGGVLWHPAPGGGACFPDGDGWIYVSNSEAPLLGGASAIRFGPGGAVSGAYRILSGTDLNRAGGRTPWNSWLSCEEILRGRIFECDPYGSRAAMPRLAMGRFRHEAASCDPDRGVVYLTEDEPDGCFYRFRPAYWGDLTSGVLEVLCATSGRGRVTWRRVPDPGGSRAATRDQVGDARRFSGGEGCHYADGRCLFTARGDNRVWAYDAENERLEVARDADTPAAGAATPSDGLYVAEDGGDPQINLITPGRGVIPVVRIPGHPGTEITGPAFSPGGDRLYFSARRGPRGDATDGVTYEVTGPFRR